MNGPLYDDVRFEPLDGERCGRFFVVALDSPFEKQKWTLYTERNGFDAPEFSCDHVFELSKYLNSQGKSLAKITEPPTTAKTPKKEVPTR